VKQFSSLSSSTHSQHPFEADFDREIDENMQKCLLCDTAIKHHYALEFGAEEEKEW
jgi:hypothetical protein